MTVDVKSAVAAAPPVTVGPLVLFGVPLSDLVLLATFVWTLLLIAEKLYALHKQCRDRRENKNGK